MANLERGFRRLTWVVSLVLAIPLIAFGLYGGAHGDGDFAFYLVLLGAIVFGLAWLVFFVLRWVGRGFQGGKPTGTESAESTEDDDEDEEETEVVWWRRLLRPFARLFAFSYYGRPHCRFPALWKDSWGIIHVVCGDPPVDTIDVKGLEATLERLKGGDHAMASVLPGLLSATMDESGGVPACERHKGFVYEQITEMFDGLSEQEQQAFKDWLSARK